MADLKQRYAQAFGEDSLIAQELMNQYNNESADKQMSFQEYMSNTAHTREVADLVRAGLNPVLSANAGAPAMPGAYATVDNTSVSASAQKKMQKELQANEFAQQARLQVADLRNQQIMNKYSADKAAQTGRYAARVGAAATKAAASMSASAAMYGADSSASATRYASDNQLTNNREQRDWDSAHPNNPYQLGGSILDLIGGNRNTSYAVGKSSAR